MQNEKQSLVFFGSGPVAAESLRLLTDSFTIEAIITKPTTEKEMSNISPETPLLKADSKASLDKLFFEHNFSSKIAVLIDFGIIVSQQIIDYFPLGIVNSHFSLLPELRGADPISFAILEGKHKTGVSLMLLVQAMDEGPLIATKELALTGTETATQLTQDLVVMSAAMLIETVPKFISGEINIVEQQGSPSYTRKLSKQDGIVDWTKSAEQLEREIRAFISWPKSRATLGSVETILTRAHSTPTNQPNDTPGTIELIPDTHMLRVACGSGSLWIDQLKPAGKKEMSIEAFLAGYKSKLLS